MKIAAIGDIHGNPIWKDFIKELDDFNKVIFLGDYVDGRTYSDEETITNLKEIIKYKKVNLDKVDLLMGNHCNAYKYYPDPIVRCSRFRNPIALELKALYNLNKDLFQTASQYGNYLFTHAGVCEDWFVNRFEGDKTKDIANQLNHTTFEQVDTLFDVGRFRGGSYNTGGPFWCDITEMQKYSLQVDGIIQVVGHSKQPRITQIDNVIYIDCLSGKEPDYLKIEI